MRPPPEFHGPLLRLLRKLRDLTQEKLADLIGVDVSTIRRYEKGWCLPEPRAIIKLARALEVDTINFYQKDVLRQFYTGKRIHITSDSAEDSIPQLDSSLTERLRPLPQMYTGIRVRFKFRNEQRRMVDRWRRGWEAVDVSTANWLGLTPGATIYSRLSLFTDDKPDGSNGWHYNIYATGEKAATLLDLANKVEVEVVGEWTFAVGLDWRRTGDDEENKEYEAHEGFVISEIISIGGLTRSGPT